MLRTAPAREPGRRYDHSARDMFVARVCHDHVQLARETLFNQNKLTYQVTSTTQLNIF